MRTRDNPPIWVSVAAVAGLACAGATAQVVANGGFEQPALAVDAAPAGPAPAGWAIRGSAGLVPVSTRQPLTAGSVEPPEGRQVAFVQGRGALETTVELPAAGPLLLAFAATQRADAPVPAQSLELRVDGLRARFRLGGRLWPSRAVTPPAGRYETYVARLDLPAGRHAIRLSGLSDDGATALVDAVGLSTPGRWDFGLWDPGLRAGHWRTDFASAFVGQPEVPDGLGGVFTTGACAFMPADVASGLVDVIIAAGASIDAARPCTGGPGQPPYAISGPTDHWAHSGWEPGRPHWRVGVNDEFVALQSAAWGPPNQSAPIVAAGAPGTHVSVAAADARTAALAEPGGLVAQLAWTPDPARTSGTIPWVSFAADSVRGNGRPIAIADSARAFRPVLGYRLAVADTDWRTFSVWLQVLVSGWADGLARGLMIELLASDPTGAGPFVPADPRFRKAGWNWNIRNSAYYPGAILAYFSARELAGCGPGVELPVLPSGLTLQRDGEAALRRHRVELRTLVECATDRARVANPAWGGPPLPDPLVVRHLEWGFEANDERPERQGRLTLLLGGITLEPAR